MNREYVVRGQRRTVEEIENVMAVRVTPDERGDATASADSFGAAARVADVGMPEDTLEAFERARWLFVEPTPETARAWAARETIENAEDAGKLVRRPNGRFGIVTRRLNVQLSEDIPAEEAEQVLTERGLQPLTRLRFAPNLFEVDTLVHDDALAASVDLSNDPRFTLAEPSLIEHVPVRLTPTDPRFGEQWQWANTGQGGGTVGADISAEEAWDQTLGAGIRVAVIDNGFNPAHEDLQAAIVGASGFFMSANPTAVFVQGTAGMPGSNHGTFCAGLVGARHNNVVGGNVVGGCGAAPECELMLIACLGDQVGTQTTLARAVSYAADPSTEPNADPTATGADIVVSSLGPNGAVWDLTVTLQLAIEFAAANGRNGRGLAIFWAASNGFNVDIMQDEVVSHADVIAVVRSTRMDLEDNAARGPEVELIAPGVDVVSTTGGGGYGPSTGTSFAAPCAAGSAALALSMNPELTRDELRQIMRDSADKIGGVVYDANGHNDDYGFGRVNAHQAVQLASITTRPSSGFATQGRFGLKGNFEVVAPLLAGRLAHFWRQNDAANLPWHGPTPFGSSDHYEPVALIQSNFSTAGAGPGNLEVIAHTGNRLDHYWRDDVNPFPWHGPFAIPGASGALGPALIQGRFGTKGNFEVVAALAAGRLAHFWRANDAANLAWHGPTLFGSNDVYDAVALIQSNFSTAGAGHGNLEVVTHTGNRLIHYWRDDVNPFPWHVSVTIPGSTGTSATPTLIQSGFGITGNFEVVVPMASGGLAHFWRNNDAANLPWHGPTLFGSSDVYDAVALIQSNFSTSGSGPGNLEVIAHTGNRLDHYWRDDVNPFPWHGPFAIPGATGIG